MALEEITVCFGCNGLKSIVTRWTGPMALEEIPLVMIVQILKCG